LSVLLYSNEDLEAGRVLAAGRSALLKCGLSGFHTAPALRRLLTHLPRLLQLQHQYEKPLVASGDHLQHSGHLKGLAMLALVLGLDKVLCTRIAPPNHSETNATGKKHLIS